MTSEDIKRALSEKHVKEFFLTEVKNGSTFLSNHLCMIDALAIYKSWSQQRIVAYEIKVSRSDYLRDNKINGYLKYCHELYIICPHGMIQPAEVPIEIGLMWCNPKTNKITTKRKSLFRHIEPDADLLYYIIMYRLQSDRYPFHSSKAAYFREWLAGRESNKQLGREVTTKMAMEIRRLNDQLDESRGLINQHKLIQEIIEVMKKHGIYTWSHDHIPDDLNKALSKCLLMDMDTTIRQLENVLATFKRINDLNKAQEVQK